MKKLVTLMLAAALTLGLAACGSSGSSSKPESSPAASSSENPSSSESDEGTTPSTEESTEDSSEASSEAGAEEGSLEYMFNQIYEKTPNVSQMALMTQQVDLTDADAVQYMIGLTSVEGVEEAAVSDAMITVVPYSAALVKVKEGTDIEAIAASIREGVDPRKWICVEADKVITATYENYILMVMASEENADEVYEAFKTVFGEGVSEAVTR